MTPEAGQSGRKPSASSDSLQAKRERKRETDRKSQRAVRARTKSYIAQLEKQTEALLEISKNSGQAELVQRVREQSDENRRLKDALKNIESLVQDCLGPGGRDGSGVDAASAASEVQGRTPANSSCSNPSATPAGASGVATRPEIKNSPPSSLICGDGDRDYFSVLNQALVLMEAAGSHQPCPDADDDEDLLIRAILHGWDAAQSEHTFDTGWQFLQIVDEGLFYRNGPVERVAILRVMRSMSLVGPGMCCFSLLRAHKLTRRQVGSRHEVPERQRPPAYMEPTSLQASVSHPRLADYFAWPSIRDFLIVNDLNNVPEWATAQFATEAGFRWPFELRDVAKRNITSGRYTFSKDFDQAFHQLDSFYFKSPQVASYFPPYKESLDATFPLPDFAAQQRWNAVNGFVVSQTSQEQHTGAMVELSISPNASIPMSDPGHL